MRIGALILIAFLYAQCRSISGTEQPISKEATGNLPVGGGCDGCELMYTGMPETIDAIDTSAGWFAQGQKLIVTGTVFQHNESTPARDVIIYYWQTDQNGLYAAEDGMDDKVKAHGHIRGLVKTDEKGYYRMHTIRPAPYPDDVIPAHIHFSIKEPDVINAYYTDDILFSGDSLLASWQKKYPAENRGGSGIVHPVCAASTQIAHHDIILGKNIPHYRKMTGK